MDAGKRTYVVRKAFPVQTPAGEKVLIAGTVLSLASTKGEPLVRQGLLSVHDPSTTTPPPGGGDGCLSDKALTTTYPLPDAGPVIRWKTASGRIIYLAENEKAAAGVERGKAVFLQEELNAMKGMSKEMAERVIDVKEVFPCGACVE